MTLPKPISPTVSYSPDALKLGPVVIDERPNRWPYGYCLLETDGQRLWRISPVTGPLVYAAFQQAAEGYSLRQIAAVLAKSGIVTANGLQLSASTVRSVLSNPFYIGLARAGGRLWPTECGCLVDKALFQKVQATLRQRSRLKLGTIKQAV